MKKRALVLGLGLSGKSAIKLLISQGYEVVGVDRKDFAKDEAVHLLISQGVQIFREDEFIEETFFSLVIVSPGISLNHPLVCINLQKGSRVMGEVDFALQYLQQKAVAITGTNGKTTVTLLVEHVLKEAGLKARAVGNVGASLAEYCLNPDPEEILVVELSSYQLESLDLPVFEAAVLLNITPDHLDRYTDLNAYAQAKARLQYCLTATGSLYLNEQVIAEFSPLFLTDFFSLGWSNSCNFYVEEGKLWQEQNCIFQFPESYSLLGKHDYMNAAAAWLLCQKMGVSSELFIKALKTFAKPSHRIEFVKQVRGVSYYDDSKGTNIDAVIQAVSSLNSCLVLIAGGVDKGSSYLPWKEAFQGKVKKIFVLGQAATKISQELALFFNVEIVDSMEQAVLKAAGSADKGESVLLSPGCSSFDMFTDYAHRGREFQRCVQLLEEGE